MEEGDHNSSSYFKLALAAGLYLRLTVVLGQVTDVPICENSEWKKMSFM